MRAAQSKSCEPHEFRDRANKGFTLVELVALLLITTLLVLLGLPTLVRAQQKTKQASCQFNLRQMGLAIQAYSEANGGRLPGPANLLPAAQYGPESTNELISYVAQYLGWPDSPQKLILTPQLVCPARESARESRHGSQSRKDYMLNDGRTLGEPPFGQDVFTTHQPATLSSIAATASPADCPAMADADKGNVNPTLKGWGDLPYQPVHGKSRNQLYFDWHVSSKAW
jgi:prepilin-type processing-associated H-X9-DG protein